MTTSTMTSKRRDLTRLWAGAARTDLVLNNILIVALIALCAYFATQTGAFLKLSNFEIILTNNAPIAVLVAALALLVIAGHVDLSVGSTIAFSGTLTALAATEWGLSDAVSMAIGVLAGAAAGMVNGILCGLLRFNPIIVTLGMLSVLRGTSLLIHENELFGLGGAFTTVGTGDIAGVPILIVIALGAFLLAALFLGLTPWGRYVYAIGINPQASFLAALPVRALPFALYTLTGAGAGVAGVLLVARLDGASPGALGLQMELQALTIILLGGVAFTGGRGRILGVLTAWVFLGVLSNGLTLMNVTPYVQLLAAGLALVFAASLDALGAVLGPRMEQRRKVAQQLASGREPGGTTGPGDTAGTAEGYETINVPTK